MVWPLSTTLVWSCSASLIHLLSQRPSQTFSQEQLQEFPCSAIPPAQTLAKSIGYISNVWFVYICNFYFFLLDLYISKYLAFDTNRGSFTVYYENFFINQCNSNMFDMFEWLNVKAACSRCLEMNMPVRLEQLLSSRHLVKWIANISLYSD